MRGWVSLLVLALWAVGFAMPCRADIEWPNMVLILADDMAAEDCGPYGNAAVRTPNLDRLAKQGMRFDQAFLTCSSCSPSRASIITSRYPHSTGAQQLHWPLPADQVTFVEKLKEAGYWTAQAGKWHLGEDIKPRFDVVHDASTAGFSVATKGAQAGAMVDKQDPSGCGAWVSTLRERPKGKPFFLWLAALDPHRDYEENAIPEPHQPESVVVPPYLPDVPETRRDLALYYDEITRLDGYLGQVLDELDKQGVAENTIVMFISDNGRPFPRCKTTVYDSGIRTPLIVRWPEKITPGGVCTSLVSSVDIGATLLDVAGLSSPESFQGQSFLSLLIHPDQPGRRFVYAEHNWHDYAAHERAVRDKRFKYIRNSYVDLTASPPADAVRSPTYRAMQRLRDSRQLTPEQAACFVKPRPTEELYDVQNDPHELHNLAADPLYRVVVIALRKALDKWTRETKDRVPAVRTPDDFDRETGQPLGELKRPRGPKSKDRTY